jgi:hypothetical protein
MSEIPQLKPLLLPSAIWRRLSAKLDDDDALPINLDTNVIERLTKDPVRSERLSNLAVRIWEHLEARRPGWGPWPESTEDALVVSCSLVFRSNTRSTSRFSNYRQRRWLSSSANPETKGSRSSNS